MNLIRAGRRDFPAPAGFLIDDDRRNEVAEYFADLTRPYNTAAGTELSGQSYGEMAKALIATVVPADEPVDLLVLAFSIHDMWPGRATATFLSHLCPGTPLSFALCDQGSAAPFTALRLIREHRPRRALLLAVEQAMLPYDSPAVLPKEHRGVALLCGNDDSAGSRIAGLAQHPDVAAPDVPALAAQALTELSAGHDDVRLVLGETLADAWPGAAEHTRAAAGQPMTGVWWQLADTLAESAGLVVIGDYDRDLRYLCLAAIQAR
ncbi:2-hydroxy-acid oxidase [Labedaea rhizosphaerae]|uniref:Uncharacterized protein n=1 Tax=Labedaea rhizosphaerae TaxID=598644 RepID=A0A4R6S2W2_LABRH|nr:2-hydroxy-acid oxidase [Labedaea rhizosphaerae]TDP92995.1 hypothetical protein EV186_107230 [Labedaea rhizosphaerae]